MKHIQLQLAGVLVIAHDPHGNRMLAYAPYVANTWRADSEATSDAAAQRTVWDSLDSWARMRLLSFGQTSGNWCFTGNSEPLRTSHT